jgi:8-oxo-dGTP diphosphatase
MTKIGTICYIKKDDEVLLQKKSKELFGGDKYNAPGGKIQEGETPEVAVIREVKEETGLSVSNLVYHGFIDFYDGDESQIAWQVHVFSTEEFEGELEVKTREGVHEWIHKNQMPYDRMWEDDKYFVPQVLEGKLIVEGNFYFEKGFGPIYKHSITIK